MKCEGVDLSKATEDDWMAAIDKIRSAVDDGQIRRFTGNDYTRDMANGDVSAIIGWSGDAIQLQADNPDIQFRMPTEGCVLWSDNMVIPVGAPNPTAAEAFMNYAYDPKHQAQIAAYNYYVTPVKGVKPILKKTAPDAAKSQLVFPTEQFTKKCFYQPDLTGEEEQRVTRAFEGVLQG
jgi:spermidine/putrescine transport system substrate-binding protein